MALNKKDDYVTFFNGTTYVPERFKTIGQLRNWLREVADDLPSDDTLRIAETSFRDNELSYLLEDGFVSDAEDDRRT